MDKATESMVGNMVKSAVVKKIDKNVHPHVQTSSSPPHIFLEGLDFQYNIRSNQDMRYRNHTSNLLIT
ncbi:hypothetical protein [Heliobacterium chlorum]|uniref:hypothetical protein n=1 Tax=Heliobacterium chlorum TaxID=2698 RepID=UPI00165D3236|nr:hypothetical protein [Heliobacterium chlorum]